jgi:hypothetical protein
MQPWRLEATFGILEELLRHIAHGGPLEEVAPGELIYVSRKDGKAYPVAEFIESYAEIFAIGRQRDPACPDVAALHAAARQIGAGQIDAPAIEAALACCTALRAYVGNKAPRDLYDAVLTAEIKIRMEAQDG